jgi:hypothetical protein
MLEKTILVWPWKSVNCAIFASLAEEACFAFNDFVLSCIYRLIEAAGVFRLRGNQSVIRNIQIAGRGGIRAILIALLANETETGYSTII